ncbi:MAG TPA: sensor histidine kinase [Chitinophagaceae bacterium]|nr:sensor histidine kinase [Chitinophagaceae bacterium]
MDKEIPIISFQIQNEMDIMLAHRRGMQFARFSGIGLSEQTRFATAISEICRNAFEYAGKGIIHFAVVLKKNKAALLATITDEGPGIRDLDKILDRNPELYRGRGLGLVYARRLGDQFGIQTGPKGTTIQIEKAIPLKTAPASKLVINGWLQHLEKEPVISAYEELKMRNIQLMELAEESRNQTRMVEAQNNEIRHLNEQLHQSNDRLKEFTYAISHDLKTPLSSLRMASDYLDEHPRGKETKIYKGILSRSVNRLDKTVRSLIEILDFQDTGRQVIKSLNFDEIFAEARDEYQQFIDEAEAHIDYNFNSIPGIDYVESYLQSLFHNLLSNALKYRDLSRQLIVKVSTATEGTNVLLIFSDNGTGMDLDMIKDRVFAPFARFSRQAEGKGIGLFLIKSMVENNGGSVTVESRLGEGTTFRFLLVPYKL